MGTNNDEWNIVYYYSFCYLLPIYLLLYYFGILHGYPCNFTPCPDGGASPAPLDSKSEALPTQLCGPFSITLFKDVYELNDVSNYVILMIIRLSFT